MSAPESGCEAAQAAAGFAPAKVERSEDILLSWGELAGVSCGFGTGGGEEEHKEKEWRGDVGEGERIPEIVGLDLRQI